MEVSEAKTLEGWGRSFKQRADAEVVFEKQQEASAAGGPELQKVTQDKLGDWLWPPPSQWLGLLISDKNSFQ